MSNVPSVDSVKTGDKIWRFLLRAKDSSRLKRRLHKGHDEEHGDQEWMFHFIDIIYVGTMFQISHIFEHCGGNTMVYVLCCSYFVIMFNTRSAFDVYMCISGAKGVPLICAFAMYGIGVFVMTLNSTVLEEGDSTHASVALTEVTAMTAQDGTFGSKECGISYHYNIAFASAFLFTRFTLFVMYLLYFCVFHETNTIGTAPIWEPVPPVPLPDKKWCCFSTKITNANKYAADFSPEQVEAVLSGAVGRYLALFPNAKNIEIPTKAYIVEVEDVTKADAVKAHKWCVIWSKVVPLFISSVPMAFLIANWVDPVILLAVVAAIEIFFDMVVTWGASEYDWKALGIEWSFINHRLGLFFMLTLGEAVLNLAIQEHQVNPEFSTSFIVCAFILVFSLGLEYFEKLHTDRKDAGQHPLDLQCLYPIYTWLVCLTSFCMLIVADGMVELYEKLSEHEEETVAWPEQYKKVGTGVAAVIVLTVVTKILDKKYFRDRLGWFVWLGKYYKPPVVDKNSSDTTTVRRIQTTVHTITEIPSANSETPIQVETTRVVNNSEAPVPDESDHERTLARRTLPMTLLRLFFASLILVLSFALDGSLLMVVFAALVAVPNAIEILIETVHYGGVFYRARGELEKEENRRQDTPEGGAYSPLQMEVINTSGGDNSV